MRILGNWDQSLRHFMLSVLVRQCRQSLVYIMLNQMQWLMAPLAFPLLCLFLLAVWCEGNESVGKYQSCYYRQWLFMHALCLSVFVCLSVCLSVCLCLPLCIHVSVGISLSVSVFLSGLCLSLYVGICLSVSVCLSVFSLRSLSVSAAVSVSVSASPSLSFKDRLPDRNLCPNLYPYVIKVQSVNQSLSLPLPEALCLCGICLSVCRCLSACLSRLCLSVSLLLCVCLSLSVCLSVALCLSLSLCLNDCLSLSLSLCLSLCLSL